MRDFLLLTIVLGAIPVSLFNPYLGVLFWYWVTYFNPHRFTWAYMYDFPIAQTVALPTLLGVVFTRKAWSALLTRESILLILLWIWFAISYAHAQGIELF